MKLFELYNRRKELISKGMGSHLLKRGASTLLVKGLGLPLSFLLQIILARVMLVEEYGVYAFAVSWLAILGLFVPLGFNYSYLRFIPEYRVKEQWGLLRGLLSHGNKLVFGFSAGIAVACIAVAWLFIDDNSLRLTFMIMSLFLPLRGLNKLRQAALKGLKATFRGMFPEMVLRPLLLGGSVILVFLTVSGGLRAYTVMTINGVVVVVLLLLGTFFLKQRLPHELKTESKSEHDTRHWLKVSFPLLIASGLAVLFNQTDILMIGFLEGKTPTGLYNAASRTTILLTIFASSVTAVITPNVAELYHSGRIEKLRKRIKLVTVMTGLAATLLAIPFCFFGDYILHLFGAEYVKAYPVLLILTSTHVIGAYTFSLGLFLRVTGHQNMIAKTVVIAVVLNIVFNYLLIPPFGIVGAALGHLMAAIISISLQFIYIKNKTDLIPSSI